MSDQSRKGLLGWMQGKSITRGWDAIVTMNRSKVNQLLEQQYITQFNQNSYLKRIHGTVELTDTGESLEMTGLLLSQPRMSFENASLVNSRARLTLDIVSGMVAYKVKSGIEPERIVRSYAVTEQHQFKLFMDIDLKALMGSVDEKGQVVLDFAEGYNFTSNLVDVPQAQKLVGEFFQTRFQKLPASSRRYVLGMLDFDPTDKLAPRNFSVRTQAAPGAQALGAKNYGDGAVVLFVRTREGSGDASLPSDESDFRYLIPNDIDPDTGKHRYSGSLILSSNAFFVWFLQLYLEEKIGRGLQLVRTGEGVEQAKGLRALAGGWELEGMNFEHSNGLWRESMSANETVKLMFAANEMGSSPLGVTWAGEGLLRVAWKGIGNWSFHFTSQEVMEDERSEDALVRFEHEMEFFYAVSVAPLTSIVTFEPLPGGTSSAKVEKMTGEIDLYYTFGEDCRDRLGGMISAVHAEIGDIEMPELNLFAINHLLFPEQNALLLTDGSLPGDLALFGHVNPKNTAFVLDPLTVHVESGKTQQFTLVETLAASRAGPITWSVRGIDGTRSQGEIDQSGHFTAPPRDRMEGQAVRNVVTASYLDPDTGEERSSSAMVIVVGESLVVTPSMATVIVKVAKPIELKASTLAGGTVKWTLREGGGSLQASGNTAIYTAPASIGQPVTAALIDVEDSITGSKVVATVLLLDAAFNLDVFPAFHPGLPSGASTRIRHLNNDIPAEVVSWEVIAGGGAVDAKTGIFTSPDTIDMPYSVVRGHAPGGWTGYTGYSVIFQSDYATEARWAELGVFELRATSSLNLFYNGQQQVRVEVKVEPLQVDGEDTEVSDTEFDSIVLIDAQTQEPLPRVDIEGVPEGGLWAYNETENGFVYHPGALVASADSPASPRRARVKTLWVQTRAATRLKIAASLMRDDLVPFFSNTSGSEPPNVIEPTPVKPPDFSPSKYQFKGVRVAGLPDDGLDMSTVDYYVLSLDNDGELIRFHTIEFEERKGMVQWESRAALEDGASYTGFARYGDRNLTFEQGLYDYIPDSIKPDLNIDGRVSFAKGTLLLTLHRCQYWLYRSDCEAIYARPMILRVLDEYGNQHRLQITFESPSDRNKLILTVL